MYRTSTNWQRIVPHGDVCAILCRRMLLWHGLKLSVLFVSVPSRASQVGLSWHKCLATQQLPVSEQPGARQCTSCKRWLRSAGGLAVHKCQATPESAVQVTPVSRTPDCTTTCCSHHCSQCQRCFKSRPGFNRHNCHRGQRPVVDRSGFAHQCSKCHRRFRFPHDQQRHKCRC